MEFTNEVPPRSFAGLVPVELSESQLVVDPLALPGTEGKVFEFAEQVEFWAARIKHTAGIPLAVLAYCSAASLAQGIVAALGDSKVPLILFDPEYPGRQAPQSLFRDLVYSTGGMASTEALPDLTDLSTNEALRRAGSFLAGLIERNAPDLDRTIAEELITGQRAWLSFVLSTVSAPLGMPCPDHVFLSDSGTWEAGRGSVVHCVGGSSTELFRSRTVAAELSEVLGVGVA
ncbi:hypothetical protein [Streptomyces umbrinus]|nr:hypothetical protein [Streptomyces umbrinus]